MTALDFESELARAGANARGKLGRLRHLTRRYPLGAAGAAIMVLFVFAAVFANALTAYDPLSTNAAESLCAPGRAHWLGCDHFGRDVLSRIIFGARISLAVGIGSTLIGSGLGIMTGLASGYLGGWIDLTVQRIMDILQALPLLVLALVMAAALGPSLENTIIAIAIPLVPYVARVIRSNTLAPLIVLATAQLGSAILTEASLSFLGLGVPEPFPSWGRMLSQSAAEYVRTAPWLVVFPGIAISLAVFGTNLLGDALRDILDPRQRS